MWIAKYDSPLISDVWIVNLLVHGTCLDY